MIITEKTKRVIFCIQPTTTSSDTTITTSGGLYTKNDTFFFLVKNYDFCVFIKLHLLNVE